jgi:hypothetical protein
MPLRRYVVRVHDPEHPLFEKEWTPVHGGDARLVIAELSPNGPSTRLVGGLYAEVCCTSERLRWRFYAGQGEPEVDEIWARWGR